MHYILLLQMNGKIIETLNIYIFIFLHFSSSSILILLHHGGSLHSYMANVSQTKYWIWQ